MLLTKLWDLYEQFSLKKCHSLYRKFCQLVEIDRRFSIPEHMLSEYLPFYNTHLRQKHKAGTLRDTIQRREV
jgi:hypothetical protein